MVTQGTIISSQTTFPEALRARSEPSLWLGALSFEERCTSSFLSLAANSYKVTDAMLLTYATEVHPSIESAERQNRYLATMRTAQYEVSAHGLLETNVDPYSFHQFQTTVASRIQESRAKTLVIDITCLTKIHTLALAALLTDSNDDLNWVAVYSTPENYGNLGESTKSPGWRDIIIAPLAETAMLLNEARGRGVVIPGHEADRLVVALNELEPSGGLILVADTYRRPDLRRMSERFNRKVIRQLTKMRASNWAKEHIALTDSTRLSSYMSHEIHMARVHQAPVILFPYGPKMLVFFAALQLCSEYPEGSWFVYPVPASYDVNYSEGVDRTFWLFPKLD
jgi:hypothetical protein